MHWIRDDRKIEHPRRIITHCGLEAWSMKVGNGFETAKCDMIEASNSLSDVRCKRCLASWNRITTTRRRDRSRVGNR